MAIAEQNPDQAVAEAARQDARRAQADLDARRQVRDRVSEYYQLAEENNNGMLSRLEALNELGADQPSLATAKLLLFLLFLTVEMLPVLAKGPAAQRPADRL